MPQFRLLNIVVLSACLTVVLVASGCTNSELNFRKHMELAQAKFEEGDYVTARIELLNAIKANPSSAEAYYLAAKTMTRLQDYQGAHSAYESAIELDPENRDLLLDYVAFLLAGKGFDRAVSVLRGALEENPMDPAFRRLLSTALAATGEKSQSVEIATRLTVDEPGSVENWLNLVNVDLLAGDTRSARKALEKAREASIPGDPRIMSTMVDLLLATGQVAAAAGYLDELAGKYPENTGYALRLGYVWGMMGRTEEAIRVYRTILERGDNATVRERLALLLSQGGHDEEAIAQWEQVLENSPRAVGPRLGIARVKLRHGDQKEAWRLVGESLEIDDRNPEALALRGSMSIDRGDFSGAAADLEKAVDQNPGNSQWRLALSEAYLGQGDTTAATRSVEEVLATDPENARAHLILARILVRQGLYRESSQHAERAAAEERFSVQALEILGNNELITGDPVAAIGYFENALESGQDNPGLRVRLATALGAAGRTERAVDILKKLLADRPNDLLPLTVCAGILSRAGRVQEALTLVRDHYIEESPGHGLLLAETLEKAGDIQEAERILRSLVETSPDFGPAYYRVVAFYSRNGRMDEATKWLEQAIEHKKNKRYRLFQLLGMLRDAGGDRRAAIGSYRSALKENPDFVPALNNLAWDLAEGGNLEEALKFSSRGRTLDSRDALLADTHGWILYLSGDAAGALPLLRQAAEDQPSNVLIREHLIEVLDAVGRNDEADLQRDVLAGQKSQ